VSTTEPQPLEAVDVVDEAVPPAGEEIHLPGGSILPLAVAVGITLTVIGSTIWWFWSLVGFIIFVISTALWVRDTRRDVDALPEDHHHH
jgi:hypothetical protein